MRKSLILSVNPLSFAWVKNVYSLGVTKGTNSGLLYTGNTYSPTYTLNSVHNYPTLTLFIHGFRTYLSTRVFAQINLLINHLYPQSTPPIIKNEKER